MSVGRKSGIYMGVNQMGVGMEGSEKEQDNGRQTHTAH